MTLLFQIFILGIVLQIVGTIFKKFKSIFTILAVLIYCFVLFTYAGHSVRSSFLPDLYKNTSVVSLPITMWYGTFLFILFLSISMMRSSHKNKNKLLFVIFSISSSTSLIWLISFFFFGL